jgi:hypothetical protein
VTAEQRRRCDLAETRAIELANDIGANAEFAWLATRSLYNSDIPMGRRVR